MPELGSFVVWNPHVVLECKRHKRNHQALWKELEEGYFEKLHMILNHNREILFLEFCLQGKMLEFHIPFPFFFSALGIIGRIFRMSSLCPSDRQGTVLGSLHEAQLATSASTLRSSQSRSNNNPNPALVWGKAKVVIIRVYKRSSEKEAAWHRAGNKECLQQGGNVKLQSENSRV